MSHRGIGLVGARALPASFQGQVSAIVSYLLSRGYRIHSGGALGADQFALQSVISQGSCSQAVIYSAWQSVAGFPRQVQPSVEHLVSHGGSVVWGVVATRSARQAVSVGLLARNLKLVKASYGIVAFLYGESRGTLSTVRRAISHGRRVVVFLCGGGSSLPAPGGGRWVPLHCSVSCWQGGYLYVNN
jgi:predicted Rossmann fold nucleotide-binding protein DprA/Smf involved in DNA uptake